MGPTNDPETPDNDAEQASAETLSVGTTGFGATVRRFRLLIVEGSKTGASYESTGDRCCIGSHLSNDFVIDDATVSRFHCEIQLTDLGPIVRDLNSRNGTILDGIRVLAAVVRNDSLMKLGTTVLRFQLAAENNRLPLSEHAQFGTLVGTSVAMRTAFALLERTAASNTTVLLEGETGTGKGRAADAIHRESARRDGPFVVVDCGALPGTLLESELFGYEKGAFTGAVERHIGAFEEASGGTIFLDEIGELAPELQPKLLRLLESRKVRRIGSNADRSVDVRVIAATNRDLRADVNSGRFRPDLYYRLAVVRILLPPLRQHPEDIPLIVDQLLTVLGLANTPWLRTPEFLATVRRSTWPGNARELRNYLEQCAVLGSPASVPEGAVPAVPAVEEPVDLSIPFHQARENALGVFEQRYVKALMKAHKWKVLKAADSAGIGRVSLWRMLARHGLKNPSK